MSDQRPKPFVFVLMPFSPDFDDVYQVGIKPACERAGAYAERVDEQIFQGSILQRIYNQIAKADVVVADMSGRNPNVFYEAGYAHALGKHVILLAQSADEIPFDLKHYSHIIYNRRIVDLLPVLEARVRAALEEPRATPRPLVRLLVNQRDIAASPEVAIEVPPNRIGFNLRLDINNDITQGSRPISVQLGLIAPPTFVSATFDERVRMRPFILDETHRLFLYEPVIEILPGSWLRVQVVPLTDNRVITPDEAYEMTVRVFGAAGFEDHPFSVRACGADTEN